MSGWIKLHRNLIDWEWYDDHNTTRLFIHCVIRANFEPKNWRGISIDRGQFWTSIPTLCTETGLSTSQIRTSLNKLKLTGELTVKSQAQGRMITIVGYNQYQADDRQVDSQVTDQSQNNDRPVTANKNEKKEKKEKKEIIIPDGINQPAWNEWIEYRKSKKKTVSPAAAKKQFKLLSDYDFDVQQQIIDQSIQNDYQGLFEPKGNTNGQNQSGRPPAANRLTPAQRVQAKRAEATARRERDVGPMGNDGKTIPRCMAEEGGRGAHGNMGETIDGTFRRSD